MFPSPVPHGATALRLEWRYLPPHVRRLVESRCGSPVVAAESQGGGFTPAFASVLECADGSRHFVKAASVVAQRAFAESYREEGTRLRRLPAATPAPALRWMHDDGEWVVLGIEHVEARPPARPWRHDDLAGALESLEAIAHLLTPPPAGLSLETFAVDLADLPGRWAALRTLTADVPGLLELPGLAGHLDDAGALASRLAEATAGTTVVHTDVRDDNLLVRPDGSVLVCDWNWLVRGAAWIDTVMLLIGPRGDGLDVEQVLADSPVTRDVAAADVDTLLAAVTGYFLTSALHPVPASSPHLRDAQWWQGEVCWDWLRERRGWR